MDKEEYMKEENLKNSNKEIELIHVFNILFKRKWLIIFPTFIITLIGIIYLLIKPGIIRGDVIVDAKNLSEIIFMVDKDTEQFSMIHYNNYIRPINIKLKTEGKKYSIEIGERDSFKITKLTDHSIYSLVITNRFLKKNKKEKEVSERIVNDFIKKFELKIFNKYYYSLIQKKMKLEKQIIDLKVFIKSENKKILIVKQYLNSYENKYTGIQIGSDNFLPPYQQYIGLKIKRDFEQIKLDKFTENLSEIDEIISIIKKKNILDFSFLFGIESIKKFELYNELKVYPEKFAVLEQQIFKSIVFFPEECSVLKIALIVFVFTFFLIILLVFLVEWWGTNKTNLKT